MSLSQNVVFENLKECKKFTFIIITNTKILNFSCLQAVVETYTFKVSWCFVFFLLLYSVFKHINAIYVHLVSCIAGLKFITSSKPTN